ncbi:hypothetical protein BDA99DRAFT_540763 [Phascolomyces articulosus]|uniref:Uncharacterized protein n=1 Tax=Phascolomyces articulosus TaxID=60185 RepID=A0AAD5PAY5_9FUNG|nr:hypothetical protein BDA99DRAFT_540763 [Phascolomyces articulosus]
MKVQTLLLGYFSDEKPVHVYRLPNNNNITHLLLYKLSDISLLFGLPHLPQHPALAPDRLANNSLHCYQDQQDLYLSTKLLGETAISLNKYQLAEFCKFKPNDYTAGLADSILDSMSRFERVKKMGPWSPLELPLLSFSSSSSSSSLNIASMETNSNHHIPSTSSYSPPTTGGSKRQQESTPPSRRNEIRSHSSNHHDDESTTPHESNQPRKSSPLVKTEPLSPPPSFVPASPSRDQNNNSNNSSNNSNSNNSNNNSNNPMALNSVLTNGDRRRSGSAADDQQQQQQGSNKRQRVDNNSNSNNNENSSSSTNNNKKRQSFRNVLPKPMHTVGSQSTTAPSTLLSKRLQSKQGKNTRHLTIFAPSYNNQPALGIRSAPLHSNFFQQQQHQHPPGTSGGMGPNGLIQPPTLASSQHPHPHPHHPLRHPQQHPSGSGHHLHPPPHPPHTGNGHHHPQQQQQQQQKTYYYGQGPSTSLPQTSQAPRMGMLHPGHTLAPLLSPRAPLPSHRDPPHTSQHPPPHHHHHHSNQQRISSPRSKQEFAIPPIVPSQQQPPLTAHPSSTAYHPYVASPMYQRNGSGGVGNSTNNNNNGGSGSGSSSSNSNGNQQGPATAALPTTARDVPLPPQTPTTNSFGSLQRQQFLQPFEHLFETIETSRTLKSTLDDQIRRSSTLMQTLQASSTTIEGLVRNQIKEAQKEMMAEMDATFENILQRIEKLERVGRNNSHARQGNGKRQDPLDRQEEEEDESSSPPPPVPSSSSSSNHALTRRQEQGDNGEDPEEESRGESSAKSTNGLLRSPPTIVRSQNDIGPNEYHGLLNALRERLDRLERQFDN